MKKKLPQELTWSNRDRFFMEVAFSQAWKAKGKTLPNPPVGAVLVKNHQIIGMGFTQIPGKAHAEIKALEQAGATAKGATLYVTLEPCSHFGKTPPCSLAIIKAGIKRVVIAIGDPNPLVGGKGIEQLRREKIKVEIGLMHEWAEIFYRPFFHYILTGRPLILLKVAQSLDGRINAGEKARTAITGPETQVRTHKLRSLCDAVMVAGDTWRSDDPDLRALKAPWPYSQGARSMDSIVFTRKGPIPLDSKLLEGARGKKTWILTEETLILPPRIQQFQVQLGPKNQNKDQMTENLVEQWMSFFKYRGYHSVLIEGGRFLWSQFLNSGCWDEFHLATSPTLFPKGDVWNDRLRDNWNAGLYLEATEVTGNDYISVFKNEHFGRI